EVEIIEEVDGGYRIVDCNSSHASEVLFITFDKVSSHIDHIPFEYPFISNNGYKHIHVAQFRRTSYQRLSLEAFRDVLEPHINKYKYIFTYGPSLGGYAAIYYASVIGAHAIAGSPRLPLHPENLKFKNILW